MNAKSTPDPRLGHHVHFYETECFLIDVVAEFLLAGLTARELVILLATPSHRRHICDAMSLRGVDVEASIAQRQLTCLDAEKTLSAFMVSRCCAGIQRETSIRKAIGDILRGSASSITAS